jgi:hypothetical protein
MVKFKNVVAYQLYGGYFSSVCGLLLTRSLLGKSIFTRAVFKHQTSNYLGTRVEIKTAHHRTKYWCLIVGPPVQLQKCLRVNIKSAKKVGGTVKAVKTVPCTPMFASRFFTSRFHSSQCILCVFPLMLRSTSLHTSKIVKVILCEARVLYFCRHAAGF